MPKRKSISSSLRWSVFARDGFTCRYCGARAGHDGVELHADHVVSVADGGDNSYDNLLTACQKCNGGKGARSLGQHPDSKSATKRLRSRAKSIRLQAEAMAAEIEAAKTASQQAIVLKATAYNDLVERVQMAYGEASLISKMCREYGADRVVQWYQTAARNDVPEYYAIKYVCGIVRNLRREGVVQ